MRQISFAKHGSILLSSQATLAHLLFNIYEDTKETEDSFDEKSAAESMSTFTLTQFFSDITSLFTSIYLESIESSISKKNELIPSPYIRNFALLPAGVSLFIDVIQIARRMIQIREGQQGGKTVLFEKEEDDKATKFMRNGFLPFALRSVFDPVVLFKCVNVGLQTVLLYRYLNKESS